MNTIMDFLLNGKKYEEVFSVDGKGQVYIDRSFIEVNYSDMPLEQYCAMIATKEYQISYCIRNIIMAAIDETRADQSKCFDMIDEYYPEKIPLLKDMTDYFEQTELLIDEDAYEYSDNVRKPYYRIRGESISAEQAFDIIRKDDNFITINNDGSRYGDVFKLRLLGTGTFSNGSSGSFGFFPWNFGWVRPDGMVGINDFTLEKYPGWSSFLEECIFHKKRYPFLNLIIGVTDWDELPDYMWEKLGELSEDLNDRLYPDFKEHLAFGICIHDNVIEVIGKKNIRKRYEEYEARYEKDPYLYMTEYYEDNENAKVSADYQLRCIQANKEEAAGAAGSAQEGEADK